MSDFTHVITIIAHGNDLSAETLATIKRILVDQATLPLGVSKSLSPRAIDFPTTISNDVDITAFLKRTFNKDTGYDVILQPVANRKDKKLFIFDMDSTLIYQEVIELIAAYADIEQEVADITERAMNGEIDFTESLKERVLLLKGINSTTIWEELKHKIKITNGALELCKALKKSGCIMGVCSGGFIQLAEYVKERLGLDYAYANVLGIDENNILDGTVVGETVNAEMKAKLLLEIASKHNIDPQTAVAVGDGANDLKMMEVAGFGVAWNAKPKVQQLAPSCLNTKSLADILYIMGYTDTEINKLIE
ncbi:Phosphoserine phosphatase [Yamadazyma tenuis]|uniref:phosphoserine phosphatase n=1 Tax=Candida tenuis (strain ATCC 10573 / BCRC 21748 / CBS 615 / JCM 9827 / NBRC 10315 / NRRL Y-1498 / VKM Y-70) TaxID=590646 RepID=G3AVY9_CANTC|nr:uncharacterized protein CANTEDRAFT_100918 [Yamadazyma tenuis ATCC 10573]EGV66413.1 hypothetical protein CANTEDRAFT_100918 [Yamadazyma tenuis ATCC 10573]WEJ95474.1 Phosphoserine phosphatase [Yamadazyma tenuis]